MVKGHSDGPVQCEVLRDFEVRGMWYRTGGKPITLRLQTAKLLQLAGKVRVLDEDDPDALQTR